MTTRRQTGSVGSQIPGTNGRGMPLNFYQNQYDQLLNNVAVPNQNFDASANMPIPGLTGPTTQSTQIPGTQPQPVTQQTQSSFSMPFSGNGRYGLLAQQLAGVGGQNMQIPQQPDATTAQAQGLLGRRGRMPSGGK